ncbi:MAG: hypothetical protein WCD86_03335 [Ktedonobacteraceae bacterium]
MGIATDPLSLLFIACFLLGFLFFIVTALLGNLGHGHIGTHGSIHHIAVGGGAHHAGVHTDASHTGSAAAHGTSHAHTTQTDGGHSLGATLWMFLNPTAIMLFLLGFGFFGYVFHNATNLLLPFTLILAAIGGIGVATVLLYLLSRVLGSGEANTVQDVSDRTGLLGKVSIPIKENSIGEILYTSPGGMRKSIPAHSIDGRLIERDQEVVVLNYTHGIAEVDTWEHFINEESTRDSQAAAALTSEDELAKLRALLEESDAASTQLALRKDVPKE